MADKDNIQTRLGSLFNFASQVPYCPNHILSLLQSVKSLIGINLDIIPQNILKYVENRLGGYEPSFSYPKNDQAELQPEVISVEKLNKKIMEGDMQAAQEYLGFLLHVANPYHITEYFLEVAAERSLSSFLFCWSAFKSVKIMPPEEIPAVLYLCLEALMETDSPEQEEIQKFLLNAYRCQIEKTPLVRKEKIIPKLDALNKKVPLNRKYVQQFPGELAYLIKDRGSEGIHIFLNNLSTEEFNDELIYQLDGLRSVIAFRDDWKLSEIFQFISSSKDVEC